MARTGTGSPRWLRAVGFAVEIPGDGSQTGRPAKGEEGRCPRLAAGAGRGIGVDRSRIWPHKNTAEDRAARQAQVRATPDWDARAEVALTLPPDVAAPFERVVECLTGTVQLPVSVVGPLAVEMGRYRLDDAGRAVEEGRVTDEVLIPLAHTEGGLSASMLRGAKATRAAGGVRTYVLADGMTRASYFQLEDTAAAVRFARWVGEQAPGMRAWLADPDNPLAQQGSATGVGVLSRHAVLRQVRTHVLGRGCHVLYRFTTGDACGPNMMTRNAHALNTHYVAERFPAATGLTIHRILLEANMGGDKKPSQQYFQEGHGKTVIAAVDLPARTLRRYLRCSVDDVVALQEIGLHGSHASGMQSAAFTPASAIAAIFAATGQDLGMVGTSSMAHSIAERSAAGVHLSIRLPGLEVGTVGGGTVLPHSQAWLRLLGCDGPDTVYRFAQIVAAAALCLELSAAAAMAVAGSENFYLAHLERGGQRGIVGC